jgi:anti-anti-sigma factor
VFPPPFMVPPPVRVVSPTSDGQVLVVLSGEIDIATQPVLSEVRAWLGEQRLPVVVDASEVTFLDCSGWTAVCALAPGDHEPVLRDPSPAVQRLLGLLDLLGRGEHPPVRAAAVAEDVRAALRSRAVVDEAAGILAAREGLTSEEARTLLAEASGSQARAVRDVAEDVVADHHRAPR